MKNLIYRLKPNEIGSGNVAIEMEKTFPDLFKAFNYKIEIPKTDRIWALENPYFYKCSLTERLTDFWFIRKEFLEFFPVKALTRGFSYYKNYGRKYKSYLPTIYQTNYLVNDKPSIGYYIRSMRSESNAAFIDFIDKIPNEIPIITMGTKECLEYKLVNRLNWEHTYSPDYFYSKCSHYFYFRCSDFIDPLPHTLLEAIQSKHRIISPINPNRMYNDGIDDLLSFISYDIDFYETKTGEFCEGLQSNVWKPYIKSVLDSNFSKPRILYNSNITLYDWACKNL